MDRRPANLIVYGIGGLLFCILVLVVLASWEARIIEKEVQRNFALKEDLEACKATVFDKGAEILAQTARADQAEQRVAELEAAAQEALIPADVQAKHNWVHLQFVGGKNPSLPMQVPCNPDDMEAEPNAEVFQYGATNGAPLKTVMVVERPPSSPDKCWSAFHIVVNGEDVKIASPNTVIGVPKGQAVVVTMPQIVRVNFYDDDIQYIFTSSSKEQTTRLPTFNETLSDPTIHTAFYNVAMDIHFTWTPPPLP